MAKGPTPTPNLLFSKGFDSPALSVITSYSIHYTKLYETLTMNNLLLLALAPIAILATYIWLRDKYEREPWTMLLKALILGALTVIPILIIERFLMGFIHNFSGYARAFRNNFV